MKKEEELKIILNNIGKAYKENPLMIPVISVAIQAQLDSLKSKRILIKLPSADNKEIYIRDYEELLDFPINIIKYNLDIIEDAPNNIKQQILTKLL